MVYEMMWKGIEACFIYDFKVLYRIECVYFQSVQSDIYIPCLLYEEHIVQLHICAAI